jgi:hypothetical protein
MSAKAKPLRWRKRTQQLGERGNVMTNHLWHARHDGEIELTRGGVVLATVKANGQWSAQVGKAKQTGSSSTVDLARDAARAWVVQIETMREAFDVTELELQELRWFELKGEA